MQSEDIELLGGSDTHGETNDSFYNFDVTEVGTLSFERLIAAANVSSGLRAVI